LGTPDQTKFSIPRRGHRHPVVYVAPNRRDGIKGATMASGEFNADAESKRPTVQWAIHSPKTGAGSLPRC